MGREVSAGAADSAPSMLRRASQAATCTLDMALIGFKMLYEPAFLASFHHFGTFFDHSPVFSWHVITTSSLPGGSRLLVRQELGDLGALDVHLRQGLAGRDRVIHIVALQRAQLRHGYGAVLKPTEKPTAKPLGPLGPRRPHPMMGPGSKKP